MWTALVLYAFASEPAMSFQVQSPAFGLGADIPARFTCSGEDLSPPLSWTGAPPGTRAFALVVDDPDAPGGTWVHWTAYNLPPTASGVPEAVRPDAEGFLQGTNDFRKRGYGGPCPPRGHGAHRYFFRVYALDQPLPLAAGATRAELDLAMRGHVLAEASWMGKSWRDR